MEKKLKTLVDKLEARHTLSRDEWISLIRWRTPLLSDYIFQKARAVRQRFYGTDVYIRGLIEFTHYGKNDCYYCGIRRSNLEAHRYRLSKEQILNCCSAGDMIWYFVTLFYRVVKTAILRMNGWPKLLAAFAKISPIARLPCLWENVPMTAIKLCLKQVQTAIYCVMKLGMQQHYSRVSSTATFAIHPAAMPLEFKGNWLSGGHWLYGRLSLSDPRKFSR